MRPWILPFICLALALASVSCSDSDSSKDTNLWWESSWAEKGEPAPIEMLTPDPQIGHPATAVVRFHADRKAEAVELTLKLLRAEEAQGKVLPAGARKAEEPVEQYVLGEFLLEEVARGLNEYELDMIVPVEGLIARPGEYNIVGCLDPRDLILEGKKAEEDSSSNEEEKDNIFAAEDVRLVFSDEYSYWPNLVVDELTFEPKDIIFSLRDILDFDPADECSPSNNTRFEANLAVSATGAGRIPGIKLEVSAVVSFPGLPIPDVSLPTLPVWIGFGDDGANEYSVQALFDLDPRGIIVLDDEDIGTSGTNQLYATGDTREFHWEICVKEYILWLQQNEYARDFLESVPIGWYSPKIVGDVTVRVVPPEGHPEYGTPVDNEETITLSLMLVNPPPVEAEREWAYSKVLGNDLIGAGLGLQSGAYVTSAAALACASAELDATLFGRTFDNLIDACGRATSLRMTSDPLDTGSLTFRVRNLEFTGGKESHAVLYERSHDVEFQEGELARVSPTTNDAECRVDSATMNLGRFTYSKSWSKCRQFVVGFVPVGLEIEVGGEVGVSADCEISLERAESKNSVSFMAGPLIAFFAAGNVFVGACPLTEPKSSDGPPRDDDDIDLGDCGKILGATVRLTFVEAQIGPRFWASLGPPESPNPLFDGRAELGAELLFRLTFLEGKVSLWTRFLVPRICWHWGFLPYPCGLKCREIGFNVASFPGFRQDFPVKNLFLQTVDLGNSYGELPDCDVCPQGD